MGKQINLSFHYHNKKIINFLNSLFTKILSRNDRTFLQSTIMTVLREIIVNAVKANTKRLYFQKQNLDIYNPDHYNFGMQHFKSFIIENQDLCENELKNENYKVTLHIKKESNGITITVSNNVPILEEELLKIQERIKKAKEYNDFTEVYTDISDDTEGEGLGIVLTILFLRNSGIGEDSFKIFSHNDKTYSSIFIPYQLQPREITNNIRKKILDEVNELPSFPENILELQKLCTDPYTPINKIADRIILDPSLSISVLKLANSAGFITRKRTENINDAIKIIGFRNLNAIIVASSAKKILDERYSIYKKIWEHCNKTALYSRYIALKTGNQKICDKVFLAGLLHDIGKIILLSTNKNLTQWISEITRKREIRTSTVIEEVSIGISHSTIGQLIAKKWNLPEYLIESIKHHHSPCSIGKEFKYILNIVYLANHICNIEDCKSDYFCLEEEVLTMFNINDENRFKKFHEELIIDLTKSENKKE